MSAVSPVAQQNVFLQTPLEVAGLCCVVATNSPVLISTLQAAFSNFPASRDTAKQSSFSLEVHVGNSEETHDAPRFRGRGHLVFASFGSNVFTFDLLRRQITGSVSLRCAHDRDFWRATLLPIAVGVLGPTLGVAPLHCACLSAEGCGLLIAGLSGAGKSTLATALAQSGLDLVSDDWTYVSSSGESLHAYGLSVPIKLLPDVASFFPELRGRLARPALNGEMAFQVDAAVLRARSAICCRPQGFMLLDRRPEAGFELRYLDKSVTREFFQRSAERLPEDLESAIRQRNLIFDQVARLPSFLLRYGGSPHAAAQRLRNWFRERFHA
jgi:hypothetical protein